MREPSQGRSDARHEPPAGHFEVFAAHDWGLLAAAAAMWGSSFLFIAIGLDDLEPAVVALLRLVFGAATVAAVPSARRALPRSEWPAIALLGLVWMAVPFLLFAFAQQRIDSSLAGMLNGAVPLFTAAVATIVLRRLPGGRQLAGLAIGFLGVVAIGWPALQGAEATALGAGMVLLATLLYGIAINLSVPLERRHGALPVLLRAQLFAIVLVAPLGLASVPGSSFSWASVAAVAALGCLGTGLAFVAFVTLVGRVGAARGSVAIYFIPVVAIVLGVVFREESVAASALLGTALVMLGAYLTSRREGPAREAAAERRARARARVSSEPVAGALDATALRLEAQLLAGPPARDPVAVAHRLLAVQGQDPRGARLAIRARTSGLSAADVDRALTEDRSLLITWLNRGTLHLVRSEDYPWLHALTAPRQLTAVARRLGQEGVTPAAAERGVAVVERSLADEGPLSRDQLAERIAPAGVRTAGQALVQVLALASLRGVAVRGPIVGGRHAYALVRDWLGEPEPVDRDRALAELARRYLAGHGPAGDRDLARWAGLPLRDARAGLDAIASELDQRDDGSVDLAGGARAADLPPPRLLGAFDPVLLGWTSRAALLGDREGEIVDGGIFRPFALVGGRAAARWRLVRGEVVLEPFRRLSRPDAAALEADAADVGRFLAPR